MYHKMKNTLMGLAAVAAFVVGGVLFSEPAPAGIAQTPRSAESSQLELAFAVATLAMNLARAEAVADAASGDALQAAQRARAEAKARATRVKLELGMPYYSFGAVLPRRAES
jgi:hypothetical protein